MLAYILWKWNNKGPQNPKECKYTLSSPSIWIVIWKKSLKVEVLEEPHDCLTPRIPSKEGAQDNKDEHQTQNQCNGVSCVEGPRGLSPWQVAQSKEQANNEKQGVGEFHFADLSGWSTKTEKKKA